MLPESIGDSRKALPLSRTRLSQDIFLRQLQASSASHRRGDQSLLSPEGLPFLRPFSRLPRVKTAYSIGQTWATGGWWFELVIPNSPQADTDWNRKHTLSTPVHTACRCDWVSWRREHLRASKSSLLSAQLTLRRGSKHPAGSLGTYRISSPPTSLSTHVAVVPAPRRGR